MIISTSAFGKAGGFGVLKTKAAGLRLYSTAPATAANGNGKLASRTEDPMTQRELFMNVLNANATKRDAKQYLARFKSPKLSATQEKSNARCRQDQDRLDRMGVNLGGLYAPGRAIAESPQFTRQMVESDTPLPTQILHVALVCLRNPHDLDDVTLDGLTLTLSQLVKLDMRIVLVLDIDMGENVDGVKGLRAVYSEQAERICRAIASHSPDDARLVDVAMETTSGGFKDAAFPNIRVAVPNLIEEPLQRGMIPVIPSLAYTPSGKLVAAAVGDVMQALSSHFGLEASLGGNSAQIKGHESAVDRIILLDQAGGIPSKDRGNGSHVFINIDQEIEDITEELSEYARVSKNGTIYAQHQENLRILQRCLKILPSASSALIISPKEGASSSQVQKQPPTGTGTRRQKNTLIHNLLTNKPLVSSSLPTARLQNTESGRQTRLANAATLVKRGMPLTIIPATNRGEGWHRPLTGYTSLDLENDPRVNFPRLLHLIEDSFRRKLNARHYLSRIKGRIAGIIVAGEYEGGAILTWEQPRGTSDASRLVPYLDKFAVLQSSQGSSGVADIVFQAMVRSCFPRGVCWRSRKDNPVNKWYFERATGSWQIPETNWTMFWTGEGVVDDLMKWADYTAVCRDVVPSWLDTKKPD